MFVLTSKNNSNIEVRFRDIYPISLSGLDYNQQATDVNYLTASVTFQYKIYEFANVSGSGADPEKQGNIGDYFPYDDRKDSSYQKKLGWAKEWFDDNKTKVWQP